MRDQEKKPSIVDVAREAGVGTTSVSRFLNPRKRMELSPKIRERIEKTIARLAYLPSSFARRRRSLGKYTFGVMTSLSKDIFHSRYHTELLSGIFDRIGQTSHDLKLFLLKERHYERLEEILYEHGIDGLLILTWRIHPKMVRLVEKAKADLPLVVFNDYVPRLRVSVLFTDVREGLKQAVFYLLEKGYRKIGMLGGPREILFRHGGKALRVPSLDSREKLEGFIEAFREKGIPVRKGSIRHCASYSEGDGYGKMREWIRKKKPLEALICANDDIAVGALRALREAKIPCPGRVALVGFDDIEKSRLVSPSLTTVRQPLYQMGYDSVDVLIGRVEFPNNEPVHRRYLPELIKRESA